MVNQLITEAVDAFRLGEVEELPTPPPTVEQLRNLMENEETERRKVSIRRKCTNTRTICNIDSRSFTIQEKRNDT